MADSMDAIVIPIDDEMSDVSHDDDSVLSDTMSICSEIRAHRYENGRRYNAFRAGEYWGPNDEAMSEHLDIAHHMFNLMLREKLFLAPVASPKNVLDIGTGTGTWAIDVADQFPQAHVLGIDLSPIQPEFIPRNCKFEVDDITELWTFPPDHFDLVHIRALLGSISDWPALYREVYDHLEPGGWINQLEMDIMFRSDDGSLPETDILVEWSKKFQDIGENHTKKTFRIAERCKRYIEDAGFINVVEKKYKVPVGPWSSDPLMKEIGRWNLMHCFTGAEAWALHLLTMVLNWTPDATRQYIHRFRSSLLNPAHHVYFETVVVYGQKPS